jgi:hypothetical protein
VTSKKKPAITPSRVALTNPYLLANERSRSKEEERPEDLNGFLVWYIVQSAAEAPTKLHVAATWRSWEPERLVEDEDDEEDPEEQVRASYPTEGGSRLGSPAWSDPWRRYLENSPSETDKDGYYVRPLAAAFDRLIKGGGRYPPRKEWADWLLRLRFFGFDLDKLASAMGWPLWQARTYVETALRSLWSCWRPLPKRHPVYEPSSVRGRMGRSESQTNADQEGNGQAA